MNPPQPAAGGAACVTLAKFVDRLRADPSRLPEAIARSAAERLLDNLGCMVFGSAIEPVRATVELATGLGLGDAAVVGWRRRTSPTAAAFANGVLAQSFELNDLGAYVHAGACVVPASLAALDVVRGEVPGASYVAAIAAGYEVTVRLAESVGAAAELDAGWHTPGFHGAVGAAASAAMLLGHDEPTIAQSLAIAADLAGGGLMLARLGTDVKRLHCGRAAETGVFAALLAGRGLKARLDVLENPLWGYARALTGGAGRLDHTRLVEGLGAVFTGFDRTGVKYYPVGAEVLSVIDSINRLKSERGFAWTDVDRVTVRTPGFFHRAEGHLFPESVSQVHFNIEYGAAMALVHDVRPVYEGPAVLDQWLSGFTDPDVRDLAGRVDHVADAELDRRNPYGIDAIVEVRRRDGRLERAETAYVAGAASRAAMQFAPMGAERLLQKFTALVSRALPGPRAGANARTLSAIGLTADVRPVLGSFLQDVAAR